jgi:polyisoprenoid-binding protein YceI
MWRAGCVWREFALVAVDFNSHLSMNLRIRRLISAALLASVAVTASAAIETYKIDPVHSSVGFSIRHFFTQVPGAFTKFGGTIVVDRDNPEKNSVEATIDVPSVDTRNTRRDDDLRSKNYFAAEQFPTIAFKSNSWKKTGAETFDVIGDLTIKGVTKQVVLKVKSLGFGPGMPGKMISGWQATTTLNRNDFGITAAQGMLGKEVDVTINVEAGLQK